MHHFHFMDVYWSIWLQFWNWGNVISKAEFNFCITSCMYTTEPRIFKSPSLRSEKMQNNSTLINSNVLHEIDFCFLSEEEKMIDCVFPNTFNNENDAYLDQRISVVIVIIITILISGQVFIWTAYPSINSCSIHAIAVVKIITECDQPLHFRSAYLANMNVLYTHCLVFVSLSLSLLFTKQASLKWPVWSFMGNWRYSKISVYKGLFF